MKRKPKHPKAICQQANRKRRLKKLSTVKRTKKYGKAASNDRRKAIAFDLLMVARYIQRPRAAQALRIARRLV